MTVGYDLRIESFFPDTFSWEQYILLHRHFAVGSTLSQMMPDCHHNSQVAMKLQKAFGISTSRGTTGISTQLIQWHIVAFSLRHPWNQRKHTNDVPNPEYQWRHTSDGPSLVSTKTHKWWAFSGINEDTQVTGLPGYQWRHTRGGPSLILTKTHNK
jgi:hypothetical protein